ncbi:N-acetylglucosamine 6-phosphate deacetylase [Marinitoga hydrogenitolerans DSM 16785]|uniref:N-acetylglucosamine 6-phosphate deacetylase n=1 Tax=Marinitoga hydrogenitolerans (strain DSM 16785 / JCM 12826 / AT1271) TaxID=1122195 RepID=A0A1M4ZU57_MARH1|nr:N-acetylglucosamine-6-phosphate deacetylase [Marinitoga hydrogenitolerans]SHF21156.1 N-acetylglucosamine 6-phosphate deacetylase [Marinitoga hydrogenitolerans DSM 16785]
MKIENVLIADPIDGEYTGDVIISNNKIEKIIKRNTEYNYILMPGFVDTHTHGYMGIDFMHLTKEELKKWAEINFSHGVTRFYPTTVSASRKQLKNIVNEFQPVLSAIGIHLEGPYINKLKKGAQNEDYIYPPKIEDLKEIINEKVKIITMAPEIGNFFNVVPYLKEHQVIISLGHSNGDYYIFKKAFNNGINRISHFPNAIKGLHHREIGGIGAGLLENFKIELIVDMIHSSPEFIKLIYKIKNIEDIILVTDSISATDLNDGEYELGGLNVFVNKGKAMLKDGTIAGSTLTFDNGIRNFYDITNCSLKELALVSSFNALKDLGVKNEGKIKEGYIANLVLLNKDLKIKSTFFEGIRVFNNEHL